MLQLAALLFLNEDPLIFIQKGELPIIISAPHGGRLPIPDCPLRTNTSAPQFVTVLDTNSDKLAEEIARELGVLCGKKPWVVIARFSRKYVDANRPEEDGTESEAGKAVYRRYHAALQVAVDAVRSDPKCLLLDIHSQGKSKGTIYRGTANLSSLKNKSLTPFQGRNGFLSCLEISGIRIEPSIANPQAKEHASFNGGFITRQYGAGSPGGVDAIQLEIGADFRTKEEIPKTAHTIAKSLQLHLEMAK
jgi:N-formylglutamate amidohydrolase